MSVFVLASSSPYRLAMLRTAGLEVISRPPELDEPAQVSSAGWTDPGEMSVGLAIAKAGRVAVGRGEFGVAADQVAWDPQHGIAFGKPKDPDAHLQRLLSLRGRPHELHTGWVVYNGDRRVTGCSVATVHVRGDVQAAEIEHYVAHGDGSGCAGGYTVEAGGSFLIERIDGDWFSVVGLPLYDILTAARELGWRYGHSHG